MHNRLPQIRMGFEEDQDFNFMGFGEDHRFLEEHLVATKGSLMSAFDSCMQAGLAVVARTTGMNCQRINKLWSNVGHGQQSMRRKMTFAWHLGARRQLLRLIPNPLILNKTWEQIEKCSS